MLLRAAFLSLLLLLATTEALADPAPADTSSSEPDDSEADRGEDRVDVLTQDAPAGEADRVDTEAETEQKIPAQKPRKPQKVVRESELPDETWLCSSEGMRDALADAAPLLVQIDARLDRVLGLAFFSEYHVLTTFSAVFWGEGLQVTLPDGTVSGARVVAHDSEADLALLELDQPINAARLSVGPPARVGDPVYAVGRTESSDKADPAIYPGVVTSTGDGRLATDALDHAFFKQGGPLLDCAGRLVGLAAGTWGERAIPIAKAQALTRLVGTQPIYRGPAVTPRIEVGGVFQGDGFSLGGGFGLAIGLTGLDGWEVKLKGGLLVLSELGGEEKLGMRVFGQTLGGYRLWFDEQHDFSLSAGLGLTLAYEQFCRDNCGDNYPPTITQTRLMPTVEVGLQIWPVTVSTQFQLDTTTPSMSVGQLLLGLEY